MTKSEVIEGLKPFIDGLPTVDIKPKFERSRAVRSIPRELQEGWLQFEPFKSGAEWEPIRKRYEAGCEQIVMEYTGAQLLSIFSALGGE